MLYALTPPCVRDVYQSVAGLNDSGIAVFAWIGVKIQGGANNNKVRNSDIGSNNGLGVHISDTDSNSNVVSESNIGHNGSLGVRIDGGAQFNLIGNSLSLAEPRTMGNWIHGNTGDGIDITTFPTAYNRVYGNNIGTGVFDLGADGNRMNGVVIDNGAAFNYIGYGGEYRNVISGNINDGVQLKGGAHDNTVQGN